MYLIYSNDRNRRATVDKPQTMNQFRIIISLTEETTVQFKVYVDENDTPVVSNVEFCALQEQVVDNHAWIRETLLMYIRDFDTRYDLSKKIALFTSFFSKLVADGVAQLVYNTEGYTQHKHTGDVVLHQETGEKVLCVYCTDKVVIDRPPYRSPSTDVTHIERTFKFHSTKHTVNPLAFSVDNLVNKSDMIVFVGDNDHGVIRTFEQFNELNNDFNIVTTADDYKKHVLALEEDDDEEKTFRCVLVVDPCFIDVALDIIKLKPEKIAAVVCDTYGMYNVSALTLLSVCHSKSIVCVRKLQRNGCFNLGVVDKREQTTESQTSGNGVITMTDDTVVSEYSYVVFIDARMAQIAKIVICLEMAVGIWTITLVHDARDDLVAGHYDYKFFPIFQTEGFFRICQMNKKRALHSIINVLTPFPAIGSMLFDSGIFVTCDKEVAIEYNKKVNAVYYKAVLKEKIKRIEVVVANKAAAYNHVVEIERKVRAVNDELITTVNKKKHTTQLHEIFKQLKIK